MEFVRVPWVTAGSSKRSSLVVVDRFLNLLIVDVAPLEYIRTTFDQGNGTRA